jgi:hypothetical protein
VAAGGASVETSRGARLGMSQDEVLRLYPELKEAWVSKVGERFNYSHGPMDCLGSYQFSNRRFVGFVVQTIKLK